MKRALLGQVRQDVRELEEDSCLASLCVFRGLKKKEDSIAVDFTQKLKVRFIAAKHTNITFDA